MTGPMDGPMEGPMDGSSEAMAGHAGAGLRRGAQIAAIAAALEAEIVSGALMPGSALRQETLARRFGVSRMPVRDALSRLEARGLVRTRPNRGAVVAPIDPDDLVELYEMRIAAETLALRKAVPRLGNLAIDAAAAVQDEMEAARTPAFARLNARFHGTLYAAAGMPRLLAHIADLARLSERYLNVAIDALDYAGVSHGEHRALIDACYRREEAAAAAILERHIRAAGERLHAALVSPKG